jgi:RNA polymerase sigma-70 factor (ECF subfamily)
MIANKELFLDYKALLFSTAYNMLGSVQDAEDMVQETYLKWMELQGDSVTYVKAYLVRIIVNKCINYLESSRKTREEYIGTWLPEPLLYHTSEDEHVHADSYHALSLGVMLLMEKLSPLERAIFILREVFVYDYRELSEIFDKSEDNCRQIFKRAKEHIGKKDRQFTVDPKAHESILNNFIQAATRGNINDLIDLFKEEITLFADGGGKSLSINGSKFTALQKPLSGKDKVGKFLSSTLSKLESVPDLSFKKVEVNGLAAFVAYMGSEPLSLMGIESDEGKISKIFVQANPDKLKQFGAKPDRYIQN